MRIKPVLEPNFVLIFIISLSSFLVACSQENTRKDIEEKLQGTWIGTVKDYNLRDANTLSVVIEKDNIGLRNNYNISDKNHKISIPDMDKKYRIFIHTNGDTIIEQRYNPVLSIIKEPIYGKLHIINENEIRVFFLFKLNQSVYMGLNLQRDGWYLKKSLP